MDGIGWLTLRYSFCWVRAHRSYLSVLEAQSQLRWPTSYDAKTDLFTPNVA